MPYAKKSSANAAARKWYAANKDKYVVWRKNRYNKYKNEVISVIQLYKANHPCSDCGNNYPSYVMDFDHIRHRGAKAKDVSALLRNNNKLEKVLAEVAKCDVVCSNCHRIRTHKRSTKRRATK